MSDDERSIEDLEQEVLDERSMRVAAERRAAELTEAVATWRRRAEERKGRLDRLEQQRRGPVRRWLGQLGGVREAPVPERSSPPPAAHPGLRATRVATVVTNPGMGPALAAMDIRALTDAASLADADLVVVEPAAFDAHGNRDGVLGLLGSTPRPPVLVWGKDPGLSAKLGAVEADLPPTFDPHLHNPAVAWMVDAPPMVAGRGEVEHPSVTLLEHAAAGGVVTIDDEPPGDPTARSMASAVARRWAFRYHAPWVRARQLLEAAGVGAFDPMPAAAGVLVSNRPDLLPSALDAFARQTYPLLTLVVGLHGAGDAAATRAMAEDAGLRHVTVLELPAAVSLGEALNRAIAQTRAAIVAKIDDDDHYGPAYIEDAVHALIYSGALISGKATQYTYLRDQDHTVLRRPGTEETLISGMPTGASLVFRRPAWETTPFPHRARQVDVHFVRGSRLAGAEVYSANRWEFRYFRGRRDHTWAADPGVVGSRAEPAFEGDHPERTEATGWPMGTGR
jgi:Glycosyl transferase family 2